MEAHTEEEIRMALSTGARVIGVNNRNLKTFQVDIKNSIRLRKMVLQDVLYVSESGIKTAEDIRALQENHTNGVLIGETLMRSPDKKKMLDKLKRLIEGTEKWIARLRSAGLTEEREIACVNRVETGLYRIYVLSEKSQRHISFERAENWQSSFAGDSEKGWSFCECRSEGDDHRTCEDPGA